MRDKCRIITRQGGQVLKLELLNGVVKIQDPTPMFGPLCSPRCLVTVRLYFKGPTLNG